MKQGYTKDCYETGNEFIVLYLQFIFNYRKHDQERQNNRKLVIQLK